MKHFIKKDTIGKLIQRTGKNSFIVNDWKVRKDLTFDQPFVDPTMVHKFRNKFNFSDTTTKMAVKGYALYGGKIGNDPTAKFYLAIQYDEVGTTI